MPLLTTPALPTGTLSDRDQPHLTVDHELQLRAWRSSDALMVQQAFDCPDIQRWHVRRLDSLDEARKWTAQWAQRWATEEAASWAITQDDKPLGQVGLRAISLTEASAGLSYWVAPVGRGRGVAAKAVEAVQRWAFEEIGFNRLNIHHSTENLASCQVATKTGFSLEGTLRQAIKHADGWHDWHLHGRLRSDG